MDNSSKWGRPHILNFYNNNRNSWKDLYNGEKIIIKKIHQYLNLGKKSKKKKLINYYIHEKRNIDSFLNLKFKHDKIESVTYKKNSSKFTNYKKPILFSTYLISKKKK